MIYITSYLLQGTAELEEKFHSALHQSTCRGAEHNRVRLMYEEILRKHNRKIRSITTEHLQFET
jgi:hypothetical protein